VRAILIAVGNALRRDDGAAHRVLQLLGPLPNVVVRDVMQLTPEMAEDIAAAEVVVVIDADVRPGETFLRPLQAEPQARTPVGHAMRPEEVVALAENLYGFRGRAYVCHVPGRDFSEGESLTPEAEANARAAAQLLRAMLG